MTNMNINQLTELTKNLTDEQRLLFTELYANKKKSITMGYVLLICFGGVGVHKFYLNNSKGWLYLLFFWTLIPGLIAFIELFTMKKQIHTYNQRMAIQIIGLIKTYDNVNIAKQAIPALLKGSSLIGIIIGILLVLATIMVSFANRANLNYRTTNVADSQEALTNNNQIKGEPTKEEILSISSIELFKEYQANEARADNKYKNITLSIRGKINNIHKLTSDSTIVSLAVDDEYGLGAINCDLPSNNELLQKISNDEIVTLIGKVDGNGLTGNAINLQDGCKITLNN